MTDATLLLRQVNPQFCSNGRPSYQVFRLTDSDKGLLSVYDGDLITAADAWKHWTEVAKKKSVGAVAVSVAVISSGSLAWAWVPNTSGGISTPSQRRTSNGLETRAVLSFRTSGAVMPPMATRSSECLGVLLKVSNRRSSPFCAPRTRIQVKKRMRRN